jgi:hypothetical protein
VVTCIEPFFVAPFHFTSYKLYMGIPSTPLADVALAACVDLNAQLDLPRAPGICVDLYAHLARSRAISRQTATPALLLGCHLTLLSDLLYPQTKLHRIFTGGLKDIIDVL